jgi:hypothetical protein
VLNSCCRCWITSVHPRFISLTGRPISDQLFGKSMLDHELSSLIIRAVSQFDRTILYHNCDPFRHLLEVDFSVSIPSIQSFLSIWIFKQKVSFLIISNYYRPLCYLVQNSLQIYPFSANLSVITYATILLTVAWSAFLTLVELNFHYMCIPAF